MSVGIGKRRQQMAISRCVVIGLIVVALADGAPSVVFSQDQRPSSQIVVDKKKLTFDPKTCTEGTGQFFWGHGSCAVKVLGHKDGDCVFEYDAEVEMGRTVYLVRVPVNSGPVSIAEGIVRRGETSYTGIITSFP